MSLTQGVDSAYPPTMDEVRLAWNMGIRWWGFYIQGIGNTDPLHAWTPGEEQILGSMIQAVPICLPRPVGIADPVLCATQAFYSCKNYGLSPKVSICYDGEHISVSGPVWIPVPGSKPISVGAQSAIQYGTGNIGSLNIDLNVSAPDWPGSNGIVCDLEANAGYTSQWYATFQTTIAQLANQPTPGMVEPMLIYQWGQGLYVSNGITFRWIQDDVVYNALIKAGAVWQGAASEINILGTPANPTTANLAGVPWPPT